MTKMSANLNTMTLNALRELGYTAQVVERYDHYTRRRYDLFGCIDMIAIKPGVVLAVQSTGTDFAGHMKKLTGPRRDQVKAWLETGQPFLLIGWRKLAGKIAPRIHYMQLGDLDHPGTPTL